MAIVRRAATAGASPGARPSAAAAAAAAAVAVLSGVLAIQGLLLPVFAAGLALAAATFVFLGWPFASLCGILLLLSVHTLVINVLRAQVVRSDTAVLLISSWKELALSYFLLVTLSVGIWARGRVLWRPRLLDLVLILALLYGLLSLTFQASQVDQSLFGLRNDFFWLVVFALARLIPYTPVQFHRWMGRAVTAAALLALWGIFAARVLGVDLLLWAGYWDPVTEQLPPSFFVFEVPGVRVWGTFVGPNEFGLFLAIMIAYVYALLLERRLAGGREPVGRSAKPIWLIVAALGLGLLLTISRSAYLAALVALTGMSLASGVVRPGNWARTALVAAGLMVLVLPFVPINNMFGNLFSGRDASAFSRIDVFADNFADIARHPLGYGPGTVGPKSTRFTDTPITLHSESWYIIMLLQYGWLGGGLYIAVFVVAAATLWRLARRQDNAELRIISLAGLGGILAMMTSALFIPSAQEFALQAFVWVGVGAALKFADERRHGAPRTAAGRAPLTRSPEGIGR